MNEDRAVAGLAALGNPTRLQVFRLLVRAGEVGLSVGEIHARLHIPASTLAHHLGTLARSGLVLQERQGRQVISRADYPSMNALIAYLTEACCTGFDESDSA